MVSKITLKKVDQNIKSETIFVVKNSPYIQWFIAFFMGALGVSSLIYDSEHNATFISIFAIGVGVVFLIKSFNPSPVITVNNTGIYSGRRLVTDWPHFAGASFTEPERKRVRVSDNFVLLVHYSKDKIPGYFKTTIPWAISRINQRKKWWRRSMYFIKSLKPGVDFYRITDRLLFIIM